MLPARGGGRFGHARRPGHCLTADPAGHGGRPVGWPGRLDQSATGDVRPRRIGRGDCRRTHPRDRRLQPPRRGVFDYVEARSVSGPGSWTTLAPLPTARANPAAAALGGLVYVAGGYSSHFPLPMSSRSSGPRTGVWTQSRKLPERRGGASAATLGGILYVVGGFVGARDQVSATALAYDPMTEKLEVRRTDGDCACPVPAGGGEGTFMPSGRD